MSRRVEINIPNRRRRGFLFISPYRRFNLPCDSFAAERLSRRGAAPSLDAARVDPLIHGRDLQARAMLLHAMHNAHGYPLSLLRRIIGRTYLTIQETCRSDEPSFHRDERPPCILSRCMSDDKKKDPIVIEMFE